MALEKLCFLEAVPFAFSVQKVGWLEKKYATADGHVGENYQL